MTLTRRDLLRYVAQGAGTLAALPASGTLLAGSAPTGAPSPPPSPLRSARPPDVAILVLDDVGYADFGCFGSEIATPAIDRIAREGLAYTNFHVTAQCTPTRACLLTGRNAHLVGAGTIAEFGRDVPGYRGWLGPDAATVAELLRTRGYATLSTGKWHLNSLGSANAAGPFDTWPTGRGFDKWYGFLGPVADHWHPELWENTAPSLPPREPGYHLSVDLTDRAIGYVRDHVVASPERPWFLYLAYGACHWPLHVPAEFVAKYAGRYDAGWDALRESRFARQQRLGLLPPGTRLAPRNPDVPAWSELSADERRFAAHAQAVYAAFLEHTDRQIGRFVDALARMGRLENTLLMVLSDNGATREGGRLGMSDVRRNHYIVRETLSDLLGAVDRLGDDSTYPAYAAGWAQAGNTPLKWYKATNFGGGTRSPLLLRWPAGRVPAGQYRRQYHHVIDVMPTLLECTGTVAPAVVDGRAQLPVQGTSFVYTFDAAPDGPTRKELQHYETAGDRAIWAAGWKAVTKHVKSSDFDTDVWELYHADADFAELDDLAAREPGRLAALQALWMSEAAANHVLPLDDRTQEFFAANVQPQRREYLFLPGMARLDRLSSPDVSRYDHRIVAALDVDAAAPSGVILAFGTSLAGYELTLHAGRLRYDYCYSRTERTTLQAPVPIGPGTHRLELAMRLADRDDPTRGAEVMLQVDGTEVARARIPRVWRLYAAAAGVRCGLNGGAPISRAYRPPFRLAGLDHVRVLLALDG